MKKSQNLSSGGVMPSIGLGTWKMDPAVAAESVRYAIVEAGYRHIDCASIYGNEKEVGEGIAQAIESGIKREDLFITSKLWNTDHHPDNVEKACKKTLSDLGLEYLDLYLVHWALPVKNMGEGVDPLDADGVMMLEDVSMQKTWSAMEKLVDSGATKSIGVANFNAPLLIDLCTYARIKPSMNQIELHPHLPQDTLVSFCKSRGIALTAYSPLGSTDSDLLSDETLIEIADTHGKTVAQVLLNWAVSRGTITIPKSSKSERIAENIDVLDFDLTPQDFKQIAKLNIGKRYVDPSDWWGVPYFD